MECAMLSPTRSSALVLSSPELIHIINYNLKRSDTVALSQTCRLTFSILLSTIWKHVNGARNLLRLIKRSSSSKDKQPGKSHEMKKKPASQLLPTVSNEQPSKDKFERFDLYAPFVEIMNVYRDDQEFFPFSKCSSLTSRSLGQDRPLLPNLKKLYVATIHERAKVSDIPMWVKTFATSSIVEVSTSIRDYVWPDDLWGISYASAGEILDTLVNSSPNIQSLELCPHQVDPDPLCPYPWTPRTNATPKFWFEYLAELPSLRYLSVTNGWLTYLSLVAISRLTTLESLSLHLGDFQGFGAPLQDIISDMSDDAFTSLRKLSLEHVTDYRVGQFRPIPKLFRVISELEVHVSREEYDEEDDLPGSTIASIFPWLVHAPHLKTLRALCPLEEAPYVIESPESLNAMTPLQIVHLERVTLGKGRLAFNLDVIWPNVTELDMPHQYASLQELAYFAAIPNLIRLKVKLRLTTMYYPDNIPTSNHSPLRTLESSGGGKDTNKLKAMIHNARVLRLLWPQLREVTWHGQASFMSTSIIIFNSLLDHSPNIFVDADSLDDEDSSDSSEEWDNESDEFDG